MSKAGKTIEKVLVRLAVEDLIPYEKNPRRIPQEAIDDVKESFRQCGVIDPIEVDEDNVILAGHTRRLAAIELGVKEVDVLRVTGLTEQQKRKYRLLANKTGEKSGWDYELLDWELEDLDFEGYDFGFDVFNMSYIDDLTEEALGVQSDNPLDTFGITLLFPKEHEDEVKTWFRENSKEKAVEILLGEVLGNA